MKNSTFSFLLGFFIVVIALAIRATGSASYADENHIHLSGTSLLSSNRTKLGLCIGNFADKDIANFVNQVQKILENIQQNSPLWQDQNYKNYQLQIETNCPREPYLLNLNAKHPLLSISGESQDYPVPIVQIPSEYRFHIYIVPDEIIYTHFQETSMRISPEEMLCDGEQCYEITTGFYFSAKETNDALYVQNKIEQLLFPVNQ